MFIRLQSVLLLILAWSLTSLAWAQPPGARQTLAPMLEEVTPAVVNVATRGRKTQENPLLQDPLFRRFFELPEPPDTPQVQNVGSGVVVDAEAGHVLTNVHVIADAEEILITLRDGSRLEAELVGADPESDVALLKVQDPEKLADLPIGDSDKLRVGDYVVAIGNPFGLGQTVTSGIVSALGRSGLGMEGLEDFIQTDASINPGNSGGALVTLDGRLIGINTAILSPAGGNIGIGFAIPINMANVIMQQLIEFGEVRRGRLGIYIQDLTPELSRALGLERGQGVVIAQVEPESPADEAGLRQGDVVVEVNGDAVTSAQALRTAVGLAKVGEKLNLKIERDGETQEVEVEVGKPEQSEQEVGQAGELLRGVTLTELGGDRPGLLVAAIKGGSPAAQAGLRPEDVVVSVNRQPVSSIAALREVLANHPADAPLLLNVRRNGGALFIVLEPPAE